MTAAERYKAQFQRPKKWFHKDEWKLTKQQKIFGMTPSNGKILAFKIA